MSDETRLGTTIPMPVPPAGWFDHGYALLLDDNLALVRTDRDVHAEHGRWWEEVQGGRFHADPPDFRNVRLRLSQFDGSIETGVVELSAWPWSKVDRLADGRWLVASSRAAPDEKNVQLFANDGASAGAFAIGDGVKHIRCAADGTIWVGYFDEGIFSGSGPDKDGGWPISSSGLVRFGPDGSVLWRFNSEERSHLFIADCYALALDGNTTWCCPYRDFPIVRIADGRIDYWKNEVTGADALAIDGDYVLLAGGHKHHAERLALVRLGNDVAQQIGEWRFKPPKRSAARLIQGQGATMHIVGEGAWTKLNLAWMRAAVKN